jgi:predicted DNA-binding transcriptional regulator YafY/fructosamine-3-kinase
MSHMAGILRSMSDTPARLLRLLSLLQTPRDWPGSELAERLQVSRRTVRRAIQRLRDLGYPVQATMGAVGGYRLVAGTAMPPLLLDDEEAVAVAVGLGTAANGTVTGIEEASVRALAKLEQVLPSRLRYRVSALHSITLPLPGAQALVDPVVLTVIATAARDRQQIRFRYTSHDGTQGIRAAEPHHLVHTGRRWYLLGWDPANNGWRTFRADRMTSPQTTGPRFTPRDPPGGDAAAYVSRSVSSAPYRYQARIRLHLPAQAAAERLPPTVGHLQADGEHACILHTGAESPDVLALTDRTGSSVLATLAGVRAQARAWSSEVRRLRRSWVGVGPKLRWVLEDSGEFPDLPGLDQLAAKQVVELGGGVDAATYLVRCPERDVVVKLKSGGLEAEARALQAWKPYTTHVPKVLGLGTVPSMEERSIRYLILGALKNDEGRLVETADEYLDRSPADARELGRAVGTELHRLHQAVDQTGFGNFADSPGSERAYGSWGGYLADFFTLHAGLVRQLGIGEDRIQATLAFIRACPFAAEARFLHGDVSVRNVAIFGYQPVTVGLFDPNPVSGDPSWDIAPMVNNVAYGELRALQEGGPSQVLVRDRELLDGFWESYPGAVAEESLLTAQLVQALLQAEHREHRLRQNQGDAIEVEVSYEFIRATVDRVAA